MTRSKYAILAGVVLCIYLGSRLTGLDLGGFGAGLMLVAIVFAFLAIVVPSINGRSGSRPRDVQAEPYEDTTEVTVNTRQCRGVQ